ncbi:MAG: DUF898 domain-containing protein [Alphaproteobacteria bacterium]|nr:DUF898 domain-containing protein [Alphaproteobacteria bacterium]
MSDDATASHSPVPRTHALIRQHVAPGALFKIVLVNLALTILTLGIYRFWGKTRVRRYLWGHVELMGERLEYTGTGAELFKGALVIVFLLLLPLFVAVGMADVMLIHASDEARAAKEASQGLVIVFLIGVAMFRARRYRLTRTSWRGIYANQTGSSLRYGLMVVASYVLAGLSVGLLWPACAVWLKRYEMTHTWIGGQRPEFTPKLSKIYAPFLIAWVIGVVYFSAVGLGFSVALGITAVDVPDLHADTVDELVLYILGFYLSLLPLSALFYWYRGRAYHHYVSSTRFMGHQATSAITGLGFAGLTIGNWLLATFTLGLAAPLVYRRYLRFVETRVGLVGEGNFDALLQNPIDKPTRGEGLADAFDVGAI